jgi:cytochrome oxidase assembly protein ShyY1
MTNPERTGRLIRSAIAVVAGNVLCAILFGLGTFAVLRLTGAEQLMASAHSAGENPAAHAGFDLGHLQQRRQPASS